MDRREHGQPSTIVTVELAPHPRGCELVLTHERLPKGTVVDQYRGGWGHIAERLAVHLARFLKQKEGRHA